MPRLTLQISVYVKKEATPRGHSLVKTVQALTDEKCPSVLPAFELVLGEAAISHLLRKGLLDLVHGSFEPETATKRQREREREREREKERVRETAAQENRQRNLWQKVNCFERARPK